MVEISTNLTGDVTAGLDKFEAKIKQQVLFSGVAAMAKVFYDEVLLNTSGAGVVKREKNFVGPMRPGKPGLVTGTLHSAVYRAYSPESSTDATKVYKVSVNKKTAPHWFWVEFGTSKMAARSYIRPAFDKVKQAIDAGNKRMAERLAELT